MNSKINTQKLDIIGDIHGHATALRQLLEKMGYTQKDGIYRHPTRKVLFLGDFIDRGAENLATVALARAMVEAGEAWAIMGNHEYNALAFHQEHPQTGDYLRANSEKNRLQHQSFLDEQKADPKTARAALDWFKTLPLFLETKGARFIHAAWNQKHIDALKAHPLITPDHGLTTRALIAAHDKRNPLHQIIEESLKGPEVALPSGKSYKDVDGIERTATRIRWWETPPITLRKAAIGVPPEQLPETAMDDRFFAPYALPKTPPVTFFGHYWLRDKNPAPLTPHHACVDYSIAKGGQLCAYRWDGEKQLSANKFIAIPAQKKPNTRPSTPIAPPSS